MKLKAHLHDAIDMLDHNELRMICEQVSLLQRMRQKAVQQDSGVALDHILSLTQSSISNWGDSVCQEREERG